MINNFFGTERHRFDAREGNILVVTSQQLAELIGYLEVTASEYEEATEAYASASERRWRLADAITEQLGQSDREVTPEEEALEDELGVLSLIVYLRIETFYVFAKILLDKLARLIPHYLGQAQGVGIQRHSTLTENEALVRFAKAKDLAPVPPSLTALIDGLSSRISKYRNQSITHAYSPRAMRGTAYSHETGETMISTHRLYPRDASDTSTFSETPRTLLPLIEQYVDELIAYLAANRDKAKPSASGRG